MASKKPKLVQQIKAIQSEMLKDEGNLVLRHVAIGELLIQLKKTAGSKWPQHLAELGYDTRVARRYMQLAKSWWAGDGLKKSELLPELPADLLKLEWLCRLTEEQLAEGVDNWRCREWSRNQVIDAVKKKLNIRAKAKPVHVVTIDTIVDDCDKFVERALETIDVSGDEIADPEARQRLLAELSDKFAAIEDAIHAHDEAQAGPVDEDEDDSSDPDDDDDQIIVS